MAISLTRHKRRSSYSASYHVFQQWLILSGLLVFGLWLAQQYQVLTGLIAGDSTRVSVLIGLIFAVTWCYCGARSGWLAREAARFDAIVSDVSAGQRMHLTDDGELALSGERQPECAGSSYLGSLLHVHSNRAAEPPDTLVDVLGERLQGAHEFGWFICGALIKLGLLGTVIGFIVMLATVDSAESFDVAAVQQLLVGMSQGMRVALYTTLVGLATSMTLSLQFLLLDRAADRLQARIVHFAQHRHLG